MQEQKIRCPKCEWEPRQESRWRCTCNHSWNTFDTYGKCPACSKVWKHTACPSCKQWSPHADWYVDLSDIDISIVKEEAVEV